MCGPTPEQTELQDQQIDAYQEANQLTQEQYADYKAITGPLTAKFSSIFNQGPNQKGFSTAEENDLKAQTVEGTAENYSSASRAVNEKLAAEGGGDNPLPSGSQEQLKEEVAQSSAQEQSKEETGVDEADWNQGYQEWMSSAEGLQAIAAGASPVSYENAATGAGEGADAEANAIASEEDQWISAVGGAVGAVGAGWAGGGFKHGG